MKDKKKSHCLANLAILKYVNKKVVQFLNGCNKVVIELWVVQFWSEIILVISNRTPAGGSFEFEITRMISDQITHCGNSYILIAQVFLY